MNRCVPDFEMDDDYAIPSSSSPSHNNFNFIRPKKTAIGGEEEIMELLWQNGQVVLQSQNQRSFNKFPNVGVVGGGGQAEITAAQQSTAREIRSLENENMPNHHHHQLFMQEDEMASWLHYPLDDSSFDRDDLYSDLLYPQPSAPITTATPSTPPRESRATIATEIRPPPPTAASLAMPPRPPIPPASKRADSEAAPRVQNFMLFSRLPPHARTAESGPSSSSKAAREFTVVDSNVTPTAGPESRVSHAADSTTQVSGRNVGFGTTSFTPAPATSRAARDLTTACELTVTSSPGGSGGSVSVSASAEPPPPNHKPSASTAEDRKRKGRDMDENECHSEDVEFESADVKKQARGSTSTKRSRAAEVHNLSERRRRDRINEKMRALQELIPRCNKSDKASMLDEAIEYLKSLQLQVQMMSMGCGMLPLMYPGVQQYMPAMGMGMGMGMGMDMGMNRPMMPYPSLIPGPGMPSPAVGANMGPRYPVPAFHMQPVPVPDSSRTQTTNQLDPMLTSFVTHNPNQPRLPNFADPYPQFVGLHPAQVPLPQNQVVVRPNKPRSSKEVGNPENR